MAYTPPAEGSEPTVGHMVPLKVLLGTAAALLVLTWATVAVYSFDLGPLNIWIALGIAFVKASLVCMFFMHLYYDRPFNAYVLIGSLLFVALFLALTMTDSLSYKSLKQEGWDAPKKVVEVEARATPAQ